jgi:hypothetical protein
MPATGDRREEYHMDRVARKHRRSARSSPSVLVQLGRSADDSGVDARRSGNRGGKAMAQHIRVDRAEDGRSEGSCPVS